MNWHGSPLPEVGLTKSDLRIYIHMNENSYDLTAVLQTDTGILDIGKTTFDHSRRSLISTAGGATE